MYVTMATIFGPIGVLLFWYTAYDRIIIEQIRIMYNISYEDLEKILWPKEEDKYMSVIIFVIYAIILTIIWPIGLVLIMGTIQRIIK